MCLEDPAPTAHCANGVGSENPPNADEEGIAATLVHVGDSDSPGELPAIDDSITRVDENVQDRPFLGGQAGRLVLLPLDHDHTVGTVDFSIVGGM